MRVARADQEELDKVQKFYNLMNALLDNRWGCDQDEEWRDWDDDDEDKKELLKIEKELKSLEYSGEIDNRIVVYEFLKKRFRDVDYCGSIGRVLTNADVLVSQVCDPDLDYLDYNKDIKKAMRYYEEMHPEEVEEAKRKKAEDNNNSQ